MPPPYRADHVGSLLRPPEVLEAHAARAAGRISPEELRAIEDRAILVALDLQRQAGLDVLSDGEYRRSSWAGEFAAAVDGFVTSDPPIAFEWRMPDGSERQPAAGTAPAQAPGSAGQRGRVVGERLRQHRRLTAHEVPFLREHAGGPFKVTLPAASYTVARGFKPGVTTEAYPARADLMRDVVAIMRAEVDALAAEGVPYIQLDNPHYPDYVGEQRRAQWQAIGIDPDAALREDIAGDNACLAGLDRARVTVATHVCRGNARSAWHSQGGYEAIAEQVFNELQVDRFLLEYDTDRAGGFEPLRFVPKGKLVVLGLVTTKESALESQDELLRRIDEAAKYLPVEALALSPQCGFASIEVGNLLSWDEQRRKLELVAETARKVWG
jgi:5-methyltetrahydropteroyltriglutamate--homocysteine methyltransferase